MRQVYFDHNATSPVHPAVRDAMLPYLDRRFGNPSSMHWSGREIKPALDEARSRVARLIGASDDEIVFTGCGSEGDNMAIKGVLMAALKKGRHLVTSAVEHAAVINTCRLMERFGFEVTYIPVDATGMIDPEDVRRAIRPDTVLVSVMHANNETGNLFPVREIASIARERGVLVHADAVQTVGKLSLDVNELGVDMLTASGHKFNAPKGIGFQYIRRGTELLPLISGGHQEHGLRAGTENMAGIVAIGTAAVIAANDMAEKQARIGALRDRLEQGILERIPETVVNGRVGMRMYNTTNISFKYIDSEVLLNALDMSGVAVSTGSACASGEPSHVLTAMQLDPFCARGAVRISLGYGNTGDDVDYMLDILPPLVERFRRMSPFYRR